MPDFKFTENAKAIYEKSISATPFPFRKIVKNGLHKLLMDGYGETEEISEEEIVKVIKKNTPKPFLGLGIDAIRPLVTNKNVAAKL
ncbi:MAG: hypothetical protein P8Y61_04420 [Gammaproteobacteria bacterium]|jgi:hypothetical protein